MLTSKIEFTKTMIHVPILKKWVTIGETSVFSGEGKEIKPATAAEKQKMFDNGFEFLFENHRSRKYCKICPESFRERSLFFTCFSGFTN